MAKKQEAGILLTGRRNDDIFPSNLPWRRRVKQAEVSQLVSGKFIHFYCLCVTAIKKNEVKHVSKNRQ